MMVANDFTIPVDKDELVQNFFGQYGDRDVVPLKMMSREIGAVNVSEKNPVDFVSQKLDLLLSVIVHGKKLELVTLFRFFDKMLKVLKNLLICMEGTVTECLQNLEIEQHEKIQLLFANKALAYILSTTLCIIEDIVQENQNNNNAVNVGNRKKSSQKSETHEEWDCQREKMMEMLYEWLQLPLRKLWTPPIVEDSFISTISQMCYKILEKAKGIKSQNMQNIIFQILGTLVKKYNHGIAFTVRVIQLIKFNKDVGASIGAGVVLMINECGCTGLIREIVREITRNEPGDGDGRNYSSFLEALANTQPEIVLDIIENITNFLDSESYVMRNCAIDVMETVVTKALTGENLSREKRDIRDECLDNLEDQILDSSAYVRSKVLQVWQNLSYESAIPLSRQNRLLKACVLRLEDKIANVRKQALQLLRLILYNNPYAPKMNRDKFSQNLEKAKATLKQLQTEVYHAIGGEKEELWNTQLPLIEEAINKFAEEYGNNDNVEDDLEENIAENESDINFQEAFNKIQNYILKDNCLQAVKYLQKLFQQLGFLKEMENESEETKKEALLLFMYKIFMNSQSNNNDVEKESEAVTEKSNKKFVTDKNELELLNRIKVTKNLVIYLQNSYNFIVEMEKTIPIVEGLLYSINSSDAIEACSFLGTAYQFEVAGALAAVRNALFQIFCKDQSVRDNLTNVYKEIYLMQSDNEMTSRAKALRSVRSLIELLKKMLPGQSIALSKLIVSWRKNKDIDVEMLKVMLEMFTLKLPNTTPEDSRSALMLLTMVAEEEMNIITNNLDLLIKVGLGPRAQTDLLLARDTCRAFLAIKEDCTNDIGRPPIRYPNVHEMFQQICLLLIEGFTEEKENGYISFATDAINVIYQLADQPAELMEEVLAQINSFGNFIRTSDSIENQKEISVYYISRFLFLIGHIGVREMVHLDQQIYKELKRRNTLKELKKNVKTRMNITLNRRMSRMSIMSTPSNTSISSNTSIPSSAHRSVRKNKTEDEQEDGMEGATADDADAEHINMCLEQELLADNGYLKKFVPIILDVCQYPEKYPNEMVQAHGVLALSKLMTISSEFCQNNMQLLVTILERSSHPQIRANILISLTDLMTRFPNEIEPWTSHIYKRLKDPIVKVRSICVQMLSNLILKEMILVKGQVAQLALCMVDEDDEICSQAKTLFKELSQKGNALYNIMPDILSCLSDSELNLAENKFQEIMKYILGLLQKDKQTESIIEKLCNRFKIATTDRQWKDLSFCLSSLNFSAKGIRILMNELPYIKENIHNRDVQKALGSIIEATKQRPETKMICQELEEKIKELLDIVENQEGEEITQARDSNVMPPPQKPAPKSVKAKKKMRRRRTDYDEEDEDDDENNTSVASNTSYNTSTRSSKNNFESDSSKNIGSEENTEITPRRSTRKRTRISSQSNKTPGTPNSTRKTQKIGKRRKLIDAIETTTTPGSKLRGRSRKS